MSKVTLIFTLRFLYIHKSDVEMTLNRTSIRILLREFGSFIANVHINSAGIYKLGLMFFVVVEEAQDGSDQSKIFICLIFSQYIVLCQTINISNRLPYFFFPTFSH